MATVPATYLCFTISLGFYSSYWAFLTLTSLFVASINIRLPGSTNVVISMGDVFTILALVHFGPGPALVTYWVDVTALTISDHVRRWGLQFYRHLLLHRFLFNLASCGLCVLAMNIGWTAAQNSHLPYPANLAAGLMLVAAAWFLVNTLTLAGAVSSWKDQRFFTVWKDSIGLYLLNFFGSASFAGLVSLFYSRVDVYIVIFTIPVAALLYRLYRYHSAQYEQAQEHITELNNLYQQAILTHEAQRRSEERYRSLVEAASDAIFSLSSDRRITSLNTAFEKITGWTSQEWTGRLFEDLIEPEDRRRAIQMLERVFRGETLLLPEMRFLRKSGEPVVVECTTTPQLQDGQVVGLLGIARDMTERKRLEETLRQSQKMEAVGRLAGGVAHDFNNLLVVILGYCDLLLATLPYLDEKSQSRLGEIKRAGERAAALTRQLLAFSRKQIMQPVVLELNSIVMNMHHMLRRLIGEDIELVNKLDPELGTVRADSGQLEQVILNLAVNSRDAMPLGGRLTIETRNVSHTVVANAVRSDARPGEYVMLSVSDTGTGISEEVRAHMFEPFFTTKQSGKGTGLGLATVYGIINQSGGYIVVDSTLGHGTTFRIFLPRAIEIAEPSPEQVVKPAIRAAETVLLVEDEDAVRTLASTILKGKGYRVLEAHRGEEAIQICREFSGPIHALVTDVIMPQISGRQLAEDIERMRPGIRVLYMSGYTDDVISHHSVLEPGTAFLQKPFSPDILIEKVRELLTNV
jgi:PAS domain S-box-containing protein